MPLEPDVAAIVDLMHGPEVPPMETLPVAEVRATTEAAAALSPDRGADVASVTSVEIGGVPCLVVRPHATGTLPVLVWFHGGGWVIGSAGMSLHTARDLAAGAGCVVVVPEYRLAPEHPFPAAFDDALAVTSSTLRRATEWSGDPGRVAVGGDSAGGNLAALAALAQPGLVFQLLAYPVTDATMTHDSYAIADNGLLTASMMRWFVRCYVGDGDRTDPRVSPLFTSAEQLASACPALVLVAEYDPLRDEGEAYAARLEEAGVPTELVRFDGQTHGFLSLAGVIPSARPCLDLAIDRLRRALGAHSP